MEPDAANGGCVALMTEKDLLWVPTLETGQRSRPATPRFAYPARETRGPPGEVGSG